MPDRIAYLVQAIRCLEMYSYITCKVTRLEKDLDASRDESRALREQVTRLETHWTKLQKRWVPREAAEIGKGWWGSVALLICYEIQIADCPRPWIWGVSGNKRKPPSSSCWPAKPCCTRLCGRARRSSTPRSCTRPSKARAY